MRAILLAAILLLAGCAGEPVEPTPATPSAPSPTPATPTDERGHRETSNGWTIEFDRASYGANHGGDVHVGFRLRVNGDLLGNVTLSLAARWATFGDGRVVRVTETDARYEATAYIGQDTRFGVELLGDEGPLARFEGPPLLVVPAAMPIPTRNETNVSDDPPGLSAVVTGPGQVRITYAPPRNATTTADEQDRAAGPFHLQLGHFGPASYVTGFVVRASSDAIANLPEPQRARVVAETEVPSGTLTVRVVTLRACFCFPQPAPEVETLVVQVP